MKHADMLVMEKAINGLKLPKDCKWFKPGFGFTCKIRDIGLDTYVECLEKDFTCRFSQPFSYSYFCTCPVRVAIAKKFKM